MDIRTKRLIEKFEESNLTQTELCNKTGINKGALSSYLSGRYFPKQQSLEKLSKALKTSIPYLMGYDEKIDSKSNNINQIAKNFESDIFTDEELADIVKYIEFIKSKRSI